MLQPYSVRDGGEMARTGHSTLRGKRVTGSSSSPRRNRNAGILLEVLPLKFPLLRTLSLVPQSAKVDVRGVPTRDGRGEGGVAEPDRVRELRACAGVGDHPRTGRNEADHLRTIPLPRVPQILLDTNYAGDAPARSVVLAAELTSRTIVAEDRPRSGKAGPNSSRLASPLLVC